LVYNMGNFSKDMKPDQGSKFLHNPTDFCRTTLSGVVWHNFHRYRVGLCKYPARPRGNAARETSSSSRTRVAYKSNHAASGWRALKFSKCVRPLRQLNYCGHVVPIFFASFCLGRQKGPFSFVERTENGEFCSEVID
jgi:hypothetical protein